MLETVASSVICDKGSAPATAKISIGSNGFDSLYSNDKSNSCGSSDDIPRN